MNIHVVVEGVGEKPVYNYWIPLANPNLNPVSSIFDLDHNNFSITAGFGFPYYFDVIEDAISDINSVDNVDRFVISVDSEDYTYEEKKQEISEFVQDKMCKAEIIIIIQHFCLETWALGNKRFGPRNPGTNILREYKRIYNVFSDDPELLPPYSPKQLNRAQFAAAYLRAMLNDKNHNLTYRKSNPKALLHPSYFKEVRNRYENFGHISSFQDFLDAVR